MNDLLWNDGMSVGNEAIDNDHKQILTLIAKITSAIDNNSTAEIIEEIFQDLENYVTSHFTREEDLLHSVNYSELEQHKASHQRFIDKIPQLKEELFRHDSLDVAEKVSYFLHNWIINHILNEDMAYTQAIHKHDSRQKKTSFLSSFTQVSKWLCRHIALTKRIFITAILPILGLFTLSFMILDDNYQQYKNMKLLSGLNHIVFQVNELTHNLQAERGLSSGFITSGSQQFSADLIERRELTNLATQTLFSELEQQADLLDNQKIQYYIKDLHDDLALIEQQRLEIDERKSNYNKLQSFYSHLIERLLTIDNYLIQINMDSNLANSLTAISALLNLKEVTGQERALGTLLIEQNKPEPEQFQQYTLLQGRQLNALEIFNYSANEQQKRICGPLCDNQLEKLSDTRLFIDLMFGNVIPPSSKQWFDIMSEKMDHFKKVTDNLIVELNKQTDLQLNHLLNRFYFVMAIITAIILANTLLLILINHSIISSIQRITRALIDITRGHKDIQVYDEFAHDEIGAMFKAYETLRREMLQADIAKKIIIDQKKSLQFRKHEQKHYEELASTDTLTGAYNRRKFEELIVEEINIANKNDGNLTILLLDIDYFKKVNDNYGHGVGDKVLQLFHQLCYRAVRFSDVIARIGGEEFVILMPQTNQKQATMFAERVRKTVDEYIMTIDNHQIHLTVSIGVSQWHPEEFNNADEWMNCADKALYEAKKSGRNQVVVKNNSKAVVN